MLSVSKYESRICILLGVGDDDIQGLTLYILHGMYNEEGSRKNKPSERSVKSEI